MSESPLIVCFGGGVNSTAMLVEMRRRSTTPDLILFADTGGERPEVYRSVEVVGAWCDRVGFPKIVTVAYQATRSTYSTLEGECLHNSKVPSLAYGSKTCSLKWKQDPQNRFVASWQPAIDCWDRGGKVKKAIGFDYDEGRRAFGKPGDDKYENWFPLIEWKIDRDKCVEICRDAGLPTEKSSCFFCPAMKKDEIRRLRLEHPDLYDRALEMESRAMESGKWHSLKGLGRYFRWSDVPVGSVCSLPLFDDANDEVPCECYDG